ncbi:putative Xre family DNA binding protein [Microlunatus phosphovorus NM-1]|uniref:Putative Xre family DNA binding protein n=1 Tax=Microlunatus phosphovorus (strain ATCC 700054 / DSM 10555 / JCM 9379 / NBRC 101784 / NCIMB 13414 / VKM Ac-1990 / NM-1) TaxID=1032480 RepID=F5XIN7_MICPN|nr:helix-turn-helix transcriptional regulator [Microlunatus phosphovorus]BAK38275.1 putative Xre family DNA binding protein [Microlunatus phosphovorus NM-1]
MPRPVLTQEDQRRGRRLGASLQRRRGTTSGAQVANQAGISIDALRKLEEGKTPTPGFFQIARIAAVLHVSLDDLLGDATDGNSKQ